MPKFLDVTSKSLARQALGLPEFNVRDFGAVGNGVADDTAAIHSARDAAGVNGTVYFPAGTYLVKNLVANVAGQLWEFGPGAIVKMDASASFCVNVTSQNVTISGGTWDCSEGTAHDFTQHGILVGASSGVNSDGTTIKNATILNAPSNAITASSTNRLTVTGCTFRDIYISAVFVKNYVPNGSIYDITLTNNLVDSVTDGSSSSSGLQVRGGEEYDKSQWAYRIRVTGNTIRLPYNPTSTFNSLGIEITNCGDYVVSDNVVSGGGTNISCVNIDRATISGNTCRGFEALGIEVGHDVNDTTVIGNSLDPDGVLGAAGIQGSSRLYSGLPPSTAIIKNLTISGNTFATFPGIPFNTPSGQLGYIDFGLRTQLDGVSITGNVIASSTPAGVFPSAVRFNGISASNVVISGNMIDMDSSPNSRGVNSLPTGAVSGISVVGNQFSNLQSAALGLATFNGATYDSVYFVNNHLQNCSTETDGTGFTSGTNIVTDETPFRGAALTSANRQPLYGSALQPAIDTWTLTGGATYSAGTGVTSGAGSGSIEFPVSVTSGTVYRVTFSGTRTSGSWTATLGSVSSGSVSAMGDTALIAGASGSQTLTVSWTSLSAVFTGITVQALTTVAAPYATGGGVEWRSPNDTSIGLGIGSLRRSVTGTNNTACGNQALTALTTGASNTAVGSQALAALTTGGSNTAVGNSAQQSLTTGASNTAVGQSAQRDLSTGGANTAVGIGAQQSLSSGGSNTSVGMLAGYSLTSAVNNVAVGREAQYNPAGTTANATTTAGGQTVIGYRAGQSGTTQVDNITVVGQQAVAGGTAATAIGSTAKALHANSVALGDGSETTATNQVAIGSRSLRINDTSLSRSAAGVLAVDSVPIATRLSNTATLDFGSVAAGSVEPLTITVTGAVTGDAVALGVPTASVLTGIAYTAYVSAANTVTVQAHNYTAGALDPASGTFKATIIR